VKLLGHGASQNRLRLAGRIGKVVTSSRTVVIVTFEGEEFREHVAPDQLELVAERTGDGEQQDMARGPVKPNGKRR
jgi:hypothetical protein